MCVLHEVYLGKVGHEGGPSEDVALAIKIGGSVLSRARSILFSLCLCPTVSQSVKIAVVSCYRGS